VPLQCRGFVVLMLAASAFDPARSTQSERAAEGVRLTLSSETVWQDEYGWYTFSAQIVKGRGSLSSRCGGAGPFGTASPGPGGGGERRRTLTDSETATLRKLYEGARLFEDGHIGADPRGSSDLPFHILIVRSSRAVVLVVSGNPTFSSGFRRALFDWLIHERQAMTR